MSLEHPPSPLQFFPISYFENQIQFSYKFCHRIILEPLHFKFNSPPDSSFDTPDTLSLASSFLKFFNDKIECNRAKFSPYDSPDPFLLQTTSPNSSNFFSTTCWNPQFHSSFVTASINKHGPTIINEWMNEWTHWTDTSLRYRHWRMCFERLLQAFARWQPGILFDIVAQTQNHQSRDASVRQKSKGSKVWKIFIKFRYRINCTIPLAGRSGASPDLLSDLVPAGVPALPDG